MPPSPNDFITIVSGLPRSGTSMMMQMLDKGGLPALTDEIRKADDDNPQGYYEFEPVKKTKVDASWLERAAGKVVKMVHVLLLDLPANHSYRVVFMRRNLDEVVASQNVMLQRGGRPTGGLSDERVKSVFEAQLAKVEKYLDEQASFAVLNVNYNDLLAEPKRQVEAVNAFLGGQLETDAMLAVVDPSLYRQRR